MRPFDSPNDQRKPLRHKNKPVAGRSPRTDARFVVPDSLSSAVAVLSDCPSHRDGDVVRSPSIERILNQILAHLPR